MSLFFAIALTIAAIWALELCAVALAWARSQRRDSSRVA